MAKERYCIIPGCNRRLITGRKYCYQHKGHRKDQGDRDKILNIVGYGLFCLIVLGLGYMLIVGIIEYAKENIVETIVKTIGMFVLLATFYLIYKTSKPKKKEVITNET